MDSKIAKLDSTHKLDVKCRAFFGVYNIRMEFHGLTHPTVFLELQQVILNYAH
jgi:hypothetical protein